MKNKGISLIVLIITIVVIIVLATAIIVTLARTNVIDNANIAQIKQDFKSLQEELNVFKADKYADLLGSFDGDTLNADKDFVEYESDEEVIEKDIYDVLPSLKRTKYKDKVKIENGILVLIGADSRTNKAAREAVGNIVIKDGNGNVEEEEIIIKANPSSTEEYVESQVVEIEVTGNAITNVSNGKYAWSMNKEEEPSNYSNFTLNNEDGKKKGTLPKKSVEQKGEYYLWIKVRSKVECFGPYKLEEGVTRENLVCSIVNETITENETKGKYEVGSKKAYSGWKCYYTKNSGEEIEITNGQTIQIDVEKGDVIVVYYKKGSNTLLKRAEVTELKRAYTLNYDTDGGSSIASKTQYDNTTFTVTEDTPTKDGYEFSCWEDESGITYNSGDTIEVTSTKTLVAKWEKLNASMFTFTPEDSTWTGVTNVKQALDYLYNN